MITYQTSCRCFAVVILTFGFILLAVLGAVIQAIVVEPAVLLIFGFALGLAAAGIVQIAVDVWRSGETLR